MKRTGVIAGLAMAAVLVGCGTPQANDNAAPGGVPAGSQAPAQDSSPTPSASPTPTVDPTALKPGANHNNAASAYTYSAADVHDWMHGRKEASPTYPRDKKLAFLTFDDGPTNSTTPEVLDALKQAGVHASFFIIAGKDGLGGADPGLLKRTVAEGHSVCIHTYSHNYKQLYPGGRANADNIVADHAKAVDEVRKVLGDTYDVHCQRYPGGHGWKGMDAADKALEAQGDYWLDWNSENGDGKSSAPGTGAGRAALTMSTLQNNPAVAVVLMHDYRDNRATVEGIAPMVKQLKQRGYEFGVLD